MQTLYWILLNGLTFTLMAHVSLTSHKKKGQLITLFSSNQHQNPTYVLFSTTTTILAAKFGNPPSNSIVKTQIFRDMMKIETLHRCHGEKFQLWQFLQWKLEAWAWRKHKHNPPQAQNQCHHLSIYNPVIHMSSIYLDE